MNIKAALPASFREELASRLPAWVAPVWFSSRADGLVACQDAEIGWLDLGSRQEMSDLINAATRMRWFNTQFAGLDSLPVQTLLERKVVVTNGTGLNAITIAEYVLMGMLTMAKGYREVVRAQDRREWLTTAPGRIELSGSRALLIGYGAIGQLVAERLKVFDVDVSVVRRSGGAGGFVGPDEWRGRLAEFDWIILAVPATVETVKMIGANELALMKPSAVILNVARGSLIDQDALLDALKARRLGGAFLDVTSPEPLPPAHGLWGLDNAHISMHLSGRSQTRIVERAARRFLDNVMRYAEGLPLKNVVDLQRGY